jgi:uncharacterized membrane protein
MTNSTPIDGLLFAATLVAALGCALMAGLFFAFSVSVMRALGRIAPEAGMAAMQAINVAILNPVFLTVFMGTAVACAVVAAAGVLRWGEPGAAWRLAGGALYLAGTFLVTVVFNVPMNEALAGAAPDDPEARGLWERYLARWTAWNHVRAAAALAATAALVLAL